MNIRWIAKELYRLKKEVESLEDRLETAPKEEEELLMDLLRKTRADRDRMQRALDGSKEPPRERRSR